jgi:isopenicillin-N epimerase
VVQIHYVNNGYRTLFDSGGLSSYHIWLYGRCEQGTRLMRDLFLLDSDIIFLNHGSFGACPAPVFDVYQEWQRELERRPVEFLGRRSADLLAESRAKLGAYLNASADDLVYVTNTTSGVNVVARSLDLQVGDEILTTNHEYGACDNVWQWVCQRAGAHYIARDFPLPIANDDEFVEHFWGGVTDKTRVIYISHMTSVTALIFPVEEICRRARGRGILTVIDGAHVPGHLPLDLTALDADFYIGNCHKWLCAPKGTAFLYAKPEHHAKLDGLVISWGYSAGVEGHTGLDAYTGNTLFTRRHQWQGTRDIAAFLTVPSAIDFQAEHNWETVQVRCHDLARETLETMCSLTGLEPISQSSAYGQMVAIPVPHSNAEALKIALYDDYRIEVPITTFAGQNFVRISFQAYNTADDGAVLVDALKDYFKL